MMSILKALAIAILAIVGVPALLAFIGYWGGWAGFAVQDRLVEFYADELPIPLLMFHGAIYVLLVGGFFWIVWRIVRVVFGHTKPGESAKIIHLKK